MINKNNVLQVTNDRGIAFNVRLVLKGDSYGRNGCLTYEDDMPLVEFYDTRYDFAGWGGLGQFVSRYYLSTLNERNVDFEGRSYGLQLDGGIYDWYVDGDNIDDILGWADYKMMKLQ